MGFADKKVELLKIVADADEELTGKLIEFAKQQNSQQNNITEEDVEKYEKRIDDFIKSGEKGYTAVESLELLRTKLK
jgi:hypothetical protein